MRQNKVLSNETLQQLIEQSEQGSPILNRQKNNDSIFPIDEIQKALRYIVLKKGDYDIWRNIAWGLGDEYGPETAKKLVQEWDSDDQEGAVIERLLQDNDGSISIGTVLMYAKKHGYKISADLKKCPLTAGQVALKYVYDRGNRYKAIGPDLYHYEGGFYQKLDDKHELKKIVRFFNCHITDYKNGKCDYASSIKAKEALDYIKNYCQVSPPMVVNPPGLNLSNGFLSITYDSNNQVAIELREHSPEIICTYKAEFPYDPNADRSIFIEAIESILPNDEEREIVLRTLAASLGISKIRAIHSRPVKALLLEGKGSNGKDSIKIWSVELYGGKGITSIPIVAFQKADGGSYEGLSSLPLSRINWASENSSCQVDECQSLKGAITGDSTLVRSLYHDYSEIEPETIFLFNSNSRMRISNSSEAITSRFAFIPFRNTFKSNPDPEKPNEIQADPRLKDDKQYIRENILPAFLNVLLEKYELVLAEGINYNVCNDAINEIVKENNHLYQFIEDTGLVECSARESFLRPQEIYERYRSWCLDEGISDNYTNSDRVISNVRALTPRLKEIFPSLKSRRDKNGQKLGLKFSLDDESEDFDPFEFDDMA